MFNWHSRKARIAVVLILLGAVGVLAQEEKKKDEPAKPKAAAAPAKPAGAGGASTPVGKPAHGPTASGGATAHGPTVNGGATTHGPTANGGVAHTTSGGSSAPTGTPATAGHTTGATSTYVGAPIKPAAGSASYGGAHPANIGISGRPAPVGVHAQQLQGGSAIQRRPNGRVSDVHDARRGMYIHHGLDGGRRVYLERADHSRIVAERGRPGYIQRPYRFQGRDFARRSYYYHGRSYDVYYRGYGYHGVFLNVYAPVRFYPVGYYGWVYHPWGAPVVFAWGFGAAPWYGFYGGYFAPYPVYPNASLWLTDYMISNYLAAEYEARREAETLPPPEQSGNAPPALTPEVKQMIADEVRNEIALENADAQQSANNQEPDPGSSSIARTLADGQPHVFVAGAALDVVDASGAECALSDGDVLQLSAPLVDPNATAASLIVLASKGRGECAKAATVAVALTDLQEMQNHMRETIDRGMEELQQKQGKGGIPAAPPSATAPPTTAAFAAVAPPPDPNDANDINSQLKTADQSEQEVYSQAAQEGAR